jgi:hypothetical protein
MAWVDFDNDGFLDLYQANGRVQRQSEVYGDNPYAEPDLLFRGAPGGRFSEVLPRGGTTELLADNSRGAAFGDVDGDGGVDVLVVNNGEAPRLLRNVVAGRGHWLQVWVVDAGRDAIGASLSLTLGGRRVTRDVRTAYSYLSCNDARVHFGLADLDRVAELSVRWLDGARERFGPFDADQVVTLVKGTGTRVEDELAR